jgi:hypothetical protein
MIRQQAPPPGRPRSRAVRRSWPVSGASQHSPSTIRPAPPSVVPISEVRPTSLASRRGALARLAALRKGITTGPLSCSRYRGKSTPDGRGTAQTRSQLQTFRDGSERVLGRRRQAACRAFPESFRFLGRRAARGRSRCRVAVPRQSSPSARVTAVTKRSDPSVRMTGFRIDLTSCARQ